jgi:hypothetical protein
MGLVLIPPARNELAADVVAAVRKDLGHTPSGRDVRNWLYTAELADWSDQPTLAANLTHPSYQRYFVAADPFFAGWHAEERHGGHVQEHDGWHAKERQRWAWVPPMNTQGVPPAAEAGSFGYGVPPLLVVARRGSEAAPPGLPGFDERNKHMLEPKLAALVARGWTVELYNPQTDHGTSFSGGPAQEWALRQIAAAR